MAKAFYRLSIFILLIIMLGFKASWSQPPDKNTYNSQYQQTLSAFTKKIADLEKEIAADKAANADPRKIKNKEEQLASLKSMLATIGGNNQQTNANNITQPANNAQPVSPYKSPIVPIPLNKPVAVPAEAQATDELLWYKGKKIDKNTIITPSGMVVRYNENKNQLIFQPDKKNDPFQKIDQELSKAEQRKNELIERMSSIKNGFFYFPDIYTAYKEYDLLVEDLKIILNNSIHLPSLPALTSAGLSQHDYNYGSGPRQNLEQDYTNTILDNEKLRQFIAKEYRKLQNLLNNLPPVDNPAPPGEELNFCKTCGNRESLSAKYRKEVKEWSEKYFEYEEKVLIETLFQIEIALNKLRTNNNPPQYYISKNADESLKKELMVILENIFQRMDEKMKNLIDRYKGSIVYHSSIIRQVLKYERLRQAYNIKNSSSIKKSGELVRELSQIFSDQMNIAMANHDYNTVLNFEFILIHEYRMQTAAGGEYSIPEWVKRVVKFNNFKLQLNIDFDIQYKDNNDKLELQATGNLKTKPGDGIDVKLGHSGCNWQLFIADAAYENPASDNEFSIPLLISGAGSIKKVKEDDNLKTYNYSGPPQLRMLFPASGISFCPGKNSDSVSLQPLHYDTDADYTALAKTINRSYSVDFLAFVNKLIISPRKVETNKDKISGMAKTIPGSSASLAATGNAILDKLQGYFNAALKRQELQKLSTQLGGLDATTIVFDAVNESPSLVNQKVEIDYQPNKRESIKGNIQLRVVQNNNN